MTKQFYAAYQCIMTDPDLEDCGTKRTLDLIIPKKLGRYFIYQYIVEKGNLVLLTGENIDKYTDKKIHLRSPMYCGSDKLCRHCVGEYYRKLDISAAGLTTGRVSNTIMAKKMKLFHNGKVKFSKVDINKLILR